MGLNVQRFLVGRQFFVVFVVFLCAQLTTYPDMPTLGVPNIFFIIVRSGTELRAEPYVLIKAMLARDGSLPWCFYTSLTSLHPRNTTTSYTATTTIIINTTTTITTTTTTPLSR